MKVSIKELTNLSCKALSAPAEVRTLATVSSDRTVKLWAVLSI
jgi:hypothetical protein